MASAVASYIPIRYAKRAHLSARLETIADQCFLIGLVSIGVISLFFAYEII
jgi:hypothetical protein